MPDLVEDLLALSPRARDAVLDALTPRERDRLDALLAQPPGAGDEASVSPWLAAHVADARRGDGAMTAAARQALIRAADAASGVAPAAATGDAAGRSLVGAMGGLFAPRRKRP